MTRLDALVAAAAEYLAEDRSLLSGSDAAQAVVALTQVLNRLEGARVELAGRVQESGVWGLDGSRSAAAWLARQTRSSRAASVRDLRLARALSEVLPLTAAAVLAGDIPVGHAQVMARTCTRTDAMRLLLGCPDRGESLILAQAHLGDEDFRRFCAAWAYRADPDAADAAYREGRDGHWLQTAVTDAGVAVRGFLSPTCGEALAIALKALIGVPAKTDNRSHQERLHDALHALAAGTLAGGTLAKTNGVRPQVVIQVPAATVLAAPGTPGVPPAWLQESRCPIPTFELDRLACDSEVLAAIMSAEGEVLRFGRAKRLFEGPLRRAMETRDGGCRYPGCSAPASQCEGHHLERWVDGGLTDLDEGCLLCWFHHIHVHAQAIRIERVGGGGLSFYDQHGQLIGTTYPCRGPDPDPLAWPSPT